MHAMASADHSVLVSVLGPSSHGQIFHSSMEGIGKSCLCCRFVHPAVDDYIADHPSLLALHEFESHVVATEPFLYWGNRIMEFDHRGSKVRVNLEVIEHTIFYHDETSRPFTGLLKLLQPQDFAKYVSKVPESSRKLSYYSRDLIGFSESYRCQGYPASPQRLPRVFVLTIDVSRTPGPFGAQLAALESMAMKLKRFPVVLAATKRDIANTESLRRLTEWADKIKLPLMETSAKDGINIPELFRVAAAKGLNNKKTKCNIPDSVNGYADASGQALARKVRERNQFASYLAKRVHSSESTLSLVDASEEYKIAVAELGKYAIDEVFAMHVLKVRNDEVGKYAGVKDDADMRLEFLEDYIETLDCDLMIHASSLRSFASHLAEQSAKEEEQKSSQPTTKSESLTAPLLHNLDCNIEEELDETDKGLTSGYVKFDSPQPSRAGTLSHKPSPRLAPPPPVRNGSKLTTLTPPPPVRNGSKLTTLTPPPPVRNGSKLTTVTPSRQGGDNSLDDTALDNKARLQYSSGGSQSMDNINMSQSLPASAFKSAYSGFRRQSEPVDTVTNSASTQHLQLKETNPNVDGRKPLPVPSPKPSRSKTSYQKVQLPTLPPVQDGSTRPSPPVPPSKPARKSFSPKTSPSHSTHLSSPPPPSHPPPPPPSHPPPPPLSHQPLSPSHSPPLRSFRPPIQPPPPSLAGLQNPSSHQPPPLPPSHPQPPSNPLPTALQPPPPLYPPPPESPPPSPPQQPRAESRMQSPIPAKKPSNYSRCNPGQSELGVYMHNSLKVTNPEVPEASNTPKLDMLRQKLIHNSSQSQQATNLSLPQSSNVPPPAAFHPQMSLPSNAESHPASPAISSVVQQLSGDTPPPIPARPCKQDKPIIATPLNSHDIHKQKSLQSGRDHSCPADTIASSSQQHPPHPTPGKAQSSSFPSSSSSHKLKDTAGSPLHQQVLKDDEVPPPPLPPRTVEMLQDVSPKRSKLKKGMFYINCTPKSKKKEAGDNKEKVKTETVVVEITPSTPLKRNTFIDMKKRPLPEEPKQVDDHNDDDNYEMVTSQGNPYIASRSAVSSPQPVRHSRPGQRLPPAPSIPPPAPPTAASPARHRAQTTAPSIDTPKQPPFPAGGRPLPIPSSSSRPQPRQIQPGDDDDGYVEVDKWLNAAAPAPANRVQHIEYDYPEVRGCAKPRPTVVNQTPRPQNIPQLKTPPRGQQHAVILSPDGDYTNMTVSIGSEDGSKQVAVDEDVYQNAEFFRKEEKRSRRHSLDLTIYMNLPDEIVEKIGKSLDKSPVKRKLPPRVLRSTVIGKQDKSSHQNPFSQPSSPKKVLSRRASFDDVYMNLASVAANSRPLPPRGQDALLDEMYMNLSSFDHSMSAGSPVKKPLRHQGHPRGSLSSQESTDGDEAHGSRVPLASPQKIALPPRRLRQQRDAYLPIIN